MWRGAAQVTVAQSPTGNTKIVTKFFGPHLKTKATIFRNTSSPLRWQLTLIMPSWSNWRPGYIYVVAWKHTLALVAAASGRAEAVSTHPVLASFAVATHIPPAFLHHAHSKSQVKEYQAIAWLSRERPFKGEVHQHVAPCHFEIQLNSSISHCWVVWLKCGYLRKYRNQKVIYKLGMWSCGCTSSLLTTWGKIPVRMQLLLFWGEAVRDLLKFYCRYTIAILPHRHLDSSVANGSTIQTLT